MEGTARIINGADLLTNEENRKELKEHVKQNKLIGLPTETVYGLGGNSMSSTSLKKIFEMKKRPTSDPLISHVFSLSQAFEQLYEINIFEKYILYILNRHFWPGPLSIIGKAKGELPLLLTANTQFCAVRLPNNKVAQEIIKICEFPIAAPSANKFQHISPTTALHVFDEFANEDLLIYDNGQCDIGIESTVVKIVKHFKKKEENGAEEINTVEEEREEVVVDKEYEREKVEENNILLQLLENSNKELIHMTQQNDLMGRLRRFDFLQSRFHHIDEERKKNSYIYNQIIKYKKLYDYSLVIYRRGKYTKKEIEDVLKKDGFLKDIKVELCQKIEFEMLKKRNEIPENSYTETMEYRNGVHNATNCLNNKEEERNNHTIPCEHKEYFLCSDKKKSTEKENTENSNCTSFVSPGMLLTHYSPAVCTYMVTMATNGRNDVFHLKEKKEFPLHCKNCILLDIGSSMSKYQSHFLKYINIAHDPQFSQISHIKYTTKHFFACLREAEKDAIELKGQSILISTIHLNLLVEEWLSLYDRIFRASSGKKLLFICNDDMVSLFRNS